MTTDEAEADEKRGLVQEDQLLVVMLNRPHGSFTEWATACRWFVHGNIERPNKELVRRVIARLVKDKLVAKNGREFALTKAGKGAAEKTAAAQQTP